MARDFTGGNTARNDLVPVSQSREEEMSEQELKPDYVRRFFSELAQLFANHGAELLDATIYIGNRQFSDCSVIDIHDGRPPSYQVDAREKIEIDLFGIAATPTRAQPTE